MTAAYELAKRGYGCTVLEARGFAGGRCQTAHGGFALAELGGEQRCALDEGQHINHGPWRIPFSHQSTLHYTQESGIPLEVVVNDNDASHALFEGGTGPLAGEPVRRAEAAATAFGPAPSPCPARRGTPHGMRAAPQRSAPWIGGWRVERFCKQASPADPASWEQSWWAREPGLIAGQVRWRLA